MQILKHTSNAFGLCTCQHLYVLFFAKSKKHKLKDLPGSPQDNISARLMSFITSQDFLGPMGANSLIGSSIVELKTNYFLNTHLENLEILKKGQRILLACALARKSSAQLTRFLGDQTPSSDSFYKVNNQINVVGSLEAIN